MPRRLATSNRLPEIGPFVLRLSRSLERTWIDRLPATCDFLLVIHRSHGLFEVLIPFWSELVNFHFWSKRLFQSKISNSSYHLYLTTTLTRFPLVFCNGGWAQKETMLLPNVRNMKHFDDRCICLDRSPECDRQSQVDVHRERERWTEMVNQRLHTKNCDDTGQLSVTTCSMWGRSGPLL